MQVYPGMPVLDAARHVQVLRLGMDHTNLTFEFESDSQQGRVPHQTGEAA
jgi:hypothetical protein